MLDGKLIKSIADRPDMVDAGEVHSLTDIGHKHTRCAIMPDIRNVAFVKDLVICLVLIFEDYSAVVSTHGLVFSPPDAHETGLRSKRLNTGGSVCAAG